MLTATTLIARGLVALKVLVVNGPAMRKVTRSLLQSIGVRTIYEATDGRSGLHAICTLRPDVVVLDWEIPSLSGPQVMRAVRAPNEFPRPDVPVIMLTCCGERSLVLEAVNLGVNELLLRPVSSQALLARFISIIANPRRMVRIGDYYGPEPRRRFSVKSKSGIRAGHGRSFIAFHDGN
jgi:CheY-like chemotaxis protein